MANKKEVMVYPQSFSNGEKAIARQNIGAGTGNGNSDITRVDLSNAEYDVDKLSIYLRSTRNAEFRDGQKSLGSTVPTPSMASQEGKVPVAYYRDGNGYFLLEQYKDPRLPDSSSSNVNQVLTVDGHGVANWANPVKGLPTVTHYAASWGVAWNTLRRLTDDILSGTTLATVTLSTPITLNANKRYMIIPEGITGSVEQTKTVAHTTDNAYNLNMWLSDSTKSISYGKTAVKMADAEIASYYRQSLGDYPPVGGTCRASFNSYPSIIEPEVDLTMDTLIIMNTGNISWGFDSDNPALLAFHNRITGIDVMEIK